MTDWVISGDQPAWRILADLKPPLYRVFRSLPVGEPRLLVVSAFDDLVAAAYMLAPGAGQLHSQKCVEASGQPTTILARSPELECAGPCTSRKAAP